MEKREDYWWRESTLGEDVDGKVGTYLRANHQEYQEIRHQIDELIQQYRLFGNCLNQKMRLR